MKKISQYIILTGGLLVAGGTFNSCIKDEDLSITEPSRYTAMDIKSYADLFKVFWSTMDQQYNSFYEQKRKDGMDWNTIYKEYYPKFLALKTYNNNSNFSDEEILADRNKAIQYFTDIIDPIIDRHFIFEVNLPLRKNENAAQTFRGGMKSKPDNVYDYGSKLNYIYYHTLVWNSLTQQSWQLDNKSWSHYVTGQLIANPDIQYITLLNFNVYTTTILLQGKYLTSNPIDNYTLTIEEIDNNPALNAIADINKRQEVRNQTVAILNKWNNFFNSPDINAFNNQVEIFTNTEVVSNELITLAKKLRSDAKAASSVLPNETPENKTYLQWFNTRITEHTEKEYGLTRFFQHADNLEKFAPFYQKFLNPLHRGDIKKLIIDLRNNGGGELIDLRTFVERFVTKNTVWGYQRTKEGNGQFNYTPWVPMQTKPHKFGIPSNIPIVILTDKGTASTSEMTTMLLKSQGNHVISVGNYSSGATGGLTTYTDLFNGGNQSTINGVMRFFMPVMTTKDANGDVVEGIGIKPDIYVSPLTDAEVTTMQNSPQTFVDRDLVEAIKYLNSK